MDIISKQEHMIFKNQDGKYCIGLSKKTKDGKYEKGYIPVYFKKDVVLANQTKIKIKTAWLDFFKVEKKTIPYIFIKEYEEVQNEQVSKQVSEQQQSIDNWDAGKNVEIDDDMLPFYN